MIEVPGPAALRNASMLLLSRAASISIHDNMGLIIGEGHFSPWLKVHSFNMASIVEFRNVGYAIGGRALLEDVSFKIEAGETLVLLGRSGSGKTTTLKLIN